MATAFWAKSVWARSLAAAEGCKTSVEECYLGPFRERVSRSGVLQAAVHLLVLALALAQRATGYMVLAFFFIPHHATKIFELHIDVLSASLGFDLSVRLELQSIDQSRPKRRILELRQIKHFLIREHPSTAIIQLLELLVELEQLLLIELRVHHNLLNVRFLQVFWGLL